MYSSDTKYKAGSPKWANYLCMNLKTYFSCILAVSHEQLTNWLAHYNEYAMGWMIRRSGFESRQSRDFSFRLRVRSGFGAYPVGIKGFRHRGMTLLFVLLSWCRRLSKKVRAYRGLQ
jgi:hypothetical protein